MPESGTTADEVAILLALLPEPPLIPDPMPCNDDAFRTARFVRFDRDPDEPDRVLVLHPDGRWHTLTGDKVYPPTEDGLPYDVDTEQPIEGRRVELPSGLIVRHLLRVLATVGAYEIWGNYHERQLRWSATPDPYNCALEDGCYRFQSLSDLYLQQIMGHSPLATTQTEPAPAGVLRVYGGVALQLARDSGFQLKMRDKSGAIVGCQTDEAGFLLRRIGAAANEADAHYWLPNGEMDIFLDLREA
jgi:hypothetical protein